MKHLNHAIIFGTILLLSGCVSVKVKTIYDETADFENYQTFCWFSGCEFIIEGPDYLKKDSATVEIFKKAIVQELESKGFVRDENNPDFLLYLHVVVEEKEGQVWTPYEGYDDYNQEYYPLGKFLEQKYYYLEGSMIIDMADAKTSKMVWRSDALRYLDINLNVTDKSIKRGIRMALKKFPPKANI